MVPRGVPRQVRGARRGRGDNIPGAMGRRTLRGPATDWREEVLLEQRLQLLGPPQTQLRMRRLSDGYLARLLRPLVLMHTSWLRVCV